MREAFTISTILKVKQYTGPRPSSLSHILFSIGQSAHRGMIFSFFQIVTSIINKKAQNPLDISIIINDNKTRDFLEKVSKKNLIRNPPPTPTSTQEEKMNFIDINNSFHFALVETTNNPWIIRSYQTLSSTIARCQFVFVLNRKIADAATKEHQRLLDLIKMGDYEGGKKLIKLHINTFLEHLLSQNDSKIKAARMP